MSEAKKRRVLQKFKAEYADRYPNIIVKSNIDEYHARCNICKADIGIGHGGLHDLERQYSTTAGNYMLAKKALSFQNVVFRSVCLYYANRYIYPYIVSVPSTLFG